MLDVDVLPSGVVVVALHAEGGSRLLWVGPSGTLQKDIRIGGRPGTGVGGVVVDTNGNVLASVHEEVPCSVDDPLKTCPSAGVRVWDRNANAVQSWSYPDSTLAFTDPTVGGSAAAIWTRPDDCSGEFCVPGEEMLYQFHPAQVTVPDTPQPPDEPTANQVPARLTVCH